MTVRFQNYSRPIGKRGAADYYQWRLFVDEPPEVLNAIKQVEYVLHPTFPNPVRVQRDPNDNFALETSGWGEFNVVIRVTFNDDQKEDLDYWLDLGRGWP